MSKNNTKNTEPLFHITKRSNIGFGRAVAIRAAAIVASVVLMSIVMFLLAKQNPITLLKSMYDGAFGTPLRIWVLFSDTAILLGNYYSQSTMRENISQIDSMVVKEVEDAFAGNFMGAASYTMTNLYPYFQSVDDPETNYLINIIVNDTTVMNVSYLQCNSLSLKHLSGMYFNGPEMVSMIGEQSVHTFKTTQGYYDNDSIYYFDMNYYPIVTEGDKVTLCIYSVNPEFITYKNDISSSFGSNPMMGMPYNVATNIYPGGSAVGFFEALSVTKGSFTY